MSQSRCNHSLIAPLFCAFVTFCSLYAPQVLLPDFSQRFNKSATEVSLLMTVPLLGLAVVPFLYGILSVKLSLIKTLRISMFFLFLSLILFALSDQFLYLLMIRFLHGIIFSILVTSIISYIAKSAQEENIKKSIQLYIGITIIGGFSGRFLSGVLNDLFHWQTVFFFLSFLSLLGFFWLFYAHDLLKIEQNNVPKKNKIIALILKNPDCLISYALVFIIFYSFVSILNYLPFYLRNLDPELSTAQLGLNYAGYLFSIIISINTNRLIGLINSTFRGILLAIVIFILGLFLLKTASYLMIFFAIFVLSIGFFFLHSILTSYINHQVSDYKEVANGFYISFYYLSASMGSYFSGIIYYQGGWDRLINFLLLMSLFAFFILAYSKIKFKNYV